MTQVGRLTELVALLERGGSSHPHADDRARRGDPAAARSGGQCPYAVRGEYMTTATPARQSSAPVMS